ncbi:MAG: type ISP restriction/modification enzyme, partial [Pseudomonadota bacterium]
PKDEKNIQPLNDDYIKFIRFAQSKVENEAQGVVGVVTNSTFLDGLIHRKMRNNLLATFQRIYILNLRGSSALSAVSDDYKDDENVFDIRQPVSIAIFVKKPQKEAENCKVFYSEFVGNRKSKYRRLLSEENIISKFNPVNYEDFNTNFRKTRWSNRFQDNLSFFTPPLKNTHLQRYGDFWGLQEIASFSLSGVKSGDDDKFIDFSEDNLKYEFGSEFDALKVSDIAYRPFDTRFIYLDQSLLSRGKPELVRHFSERNLSLVTVRQLSTIDFHHAYVTDLISDMCNISSQSKESSYVFPLYVLHEPYKKTPKHKSQDTDLFITSNSREDTTTTPQKTENFTPDFRRFIDTKYSNHYTPEEIMGYIYAILHSPTYRTKYLEFLRIDFPRIPFVDDNETFETLSKLGWELMQNHVLKQIPNEPKIELPKGGDWIVEAPVYTADLSRLYINKEKYFAPVSKEVWEFKIGGYQVLDKYLKSRKERELSLEEIENIENIIKVLGFTIQQMARIDEVWKP